MSHAHAAVTRDPRVTGSRGPTMSVHFAWTVDNLPDLACQFLAGTAQHPAAASSKACNLSSAAVRCRPQGPMGPRGGCRYVRPKTPMGRGKRRSWNCSPQPSTAVVEASNDDRYLCLEVLFSYKTTYWPRDRARATSRAFLALFDQDSSRESK